MMSPRRAAFIGLLTACVVMCATRVAWAQATPSAANGPWSGWVQCELTAQLNDQGRTYSNQQTHTWVLTSSTATSGTDIKDYPAMWTVAGGGTSQRQEGNGRTIADKWNTAGQPMPTTISFRVDLTGTLFIALRGGQLRSAGAMTGMSVAHSNNGNAPDQQTPMLPLTIDEFRFPVIRDDGKKTSITGSSEPTTVGALASGQPPRTVSTATCSWNLVRGGAAPPPPTGRSITRDQVTPPAAVSSLIVPGTAPPAAQPIPGTRPGRVDVVPSPTTTTPTPVPLATATAAPPTTTTLTPVPLATATAAPPTTTLTPVPLATATAAPPTTTNAGSGRTALELGRTNVPTVPPQTTSAPGATGTIASITRLSQEFAASGTFTVPNGVGSVTVELWGAGAGGYGGSSARPGSSPTQYIAGGQGTGGGSGAYTRIVSQVSPGMTLRIVVGAGGAGGSGGSYSARTTVAGFSVAGPGGKGGDGSSTQLTRDGTVLAEAAGGKGTLGGAKSTAPDVVSIAGSLGLSTGGGAAVPGSITPPGTSGGAGGSGASGRCSSAVGVLLCETNGHPGAAGRPGYALISWDQPQLPH